jgi:hypothetical protein
MKILSEYGRRITAFSQMKTSQKSIRGMTATRRGSQMSQNFTTLFDFFSKMKIPFFSLFWRKKHEPKTKGAVEVIPPPIYRQTRRKLDHFGDFTEMVRSHLSTIFARNHCFFYGISVKKVKLFFLKNNENR